MCSHWFRKDEAAQPALALLVFLVSAVAMGAVIYKTNNYGGGCQGPRHLFWMIPLWLLMLPAGVELFSRHWSGRVACYALFAVSLFSVYWALPQVDDPLQVPPPSRPWSMSWAHSLFQRKDLIPDSLSFMEITY
jgi:hypothetical protein